MKSIEMNILTSSGYETIYPNTQSTNLLAGPLSGQFTFNTPPKSTNPASSDDELIRLGECKQQIEDFWNGNYPWQFETRVVNPSTTNYSPITLSKPLEEYLAILIFCEKSHSSNKFMLRLGQISTMSIEMIGSFAFVYGITGGWVVAFSDGNSGIKSEVLYQSQYQGLSVMNRQSGNNIVVYSF